MRFRLAPNSSNLDDLERSKRPARRNKQKNSLAHQKNFNEDRPISLVGKCRPITLLARNIKCMRICAGVPSDRGVVFSCRILATYTCVQVVLLDRIKQFQNERVTSVCWSTTQCCHLNSFCVVFRAQMWVSALYFVSALMHDVCLLSVKHFTFCLIHRERGWGCVSVGGPSNSESAEFRKCWIRWEMGPR